MSASGLSLTTIFHTYHLRSASAERPNDRTVGILWGLEHENATHLSQDLRSGTPKRQLAVSAKGFLSFEPSDWLEGVTRCCHFWSCFDNRKESLAPDWPKYNFSIPNDLSPRIHCHPERFVTPKVLSPRMFCHPEKWRKHHPSQLYLCLCSNPRLLSDLLAMISPSDASCCFVVSTDRVHRSAVVAVVTISDRRRRRLRPDRRSRPSHRHRRIIASTST
jgi:hypothetical protein